MDTTPTRTIGNGPTGMDSIIDKADDHSVDHLRDKSDFYEINGKQLDVIATNVNKTIQDLNEIYNDIGYSSLEISLKKAQIFQVLEETIHNFTGNLEREKTNIESECEWLRQQIQIILIIVNDPQGDVNLSDMNKGLVFQDWELYSKGYKQEINKKLTILQNRRDDFYQDSPFNISANQNCNDLERNYERLLNNPVSKVSLLQLKSKLNIIFLDILKVFMKLFKKFNNLNTMLIESIETLGITEESSFISQLPNKTESQYHKELIGQFESTIKCLRLSDKPSSFGLRDTSHDNISFIVSSPRKSKVEDIQDVEQSNKVIQESELNDPQSNQSDDVMNYLRDINYKIVRVIRSLKFSKINNELLKSLNGKLQEFETEISVRAEKMNTIINQCFELITVLGYNEEQLIDVQKLYNVNSQDSEDNSGYFDSETLKFIQMNPKEFGLNSVHVEFIEKFLNLLTKIKESKLKKWDYYYKNCEKFWSRLGEDPEYVNHFVDANNNLTDNCLNNFKLELNRLFLKRSEFIDKFIYDTRQEIESLRTQLYYTETEKAKFKHFEFDANESCDKEIMLSEHEEELNRLKSEYDMKKPIIEDYEELTQLLKDQQFLIESSKDSSRLLSKNSCKILLNEERLRKRVLRNMPKLVAGLKTKVQEYNQSGTTFKIFGEELSSRLTDIESKQSRNSKSTPSSRVNSNRITKSPNKFTKSPNKVINSKKVSIRRPITTRPTFAGPSVSKTASITKPRPTPLSRNKLTALVNNTIESNNSSPWASRNSSITKAPPTNILKPLISPLKLSPISNLSPLRLNNTFFSPDKVVSPISTIKDSSIDSPVKDDHKENDKENTHGLTPIKLMNFDKNTSTPASERRSTIDSTMMIDYQQWRQERIKQLNK